MTEPKISENPQKDIIKSSISRKKSGSELSNEIIIEFVQIERVAVPLVPKKKVITNEQLLQMALERQSQNLSQIESLVKQQLLIQDYNGYPGFDKGWDDEALKIMGHTGYTGSLSDIVVFPDGTLVSQGGGGLALMEPDKIKLISDGIFTNYLDGGTYSKQANVNWIGLLERIQIGTICVAAPLLGSMKLSGIIYHETGHKLFKQPTECGVVFVQEIRLMQEKFQCGRDWAMKDGRTPEYHRMNGLKNEPGRKELIELLQFLCAEEEFYKEFKPQYEEITGKALSISQKLREKWTQENEAKWLIIADAPETAIDIIIEGPIIDLCRMIRGGVTPGKDAIKIAKNILGQGYNPPRVLFNGMQWEVLSKINVQPPVFKLQCKCLSEIDVTEINGPTYDRDFKVWINYLDQTVVYGLFEEGPFRFTEKAAAVRARDIAVRAAKAVVKQYDANEDQVMLIAAKYLLSLDNL